MLALLVTDMQPNLVGYICILPASWPAIPRQVFEFADDDPDRQVWVLWSAQEISRNIEFVVPVCMNKQC